MSDWVGMGLSGLQFTPYFTHCLQFFNHFLEWVVAMSDWVWMQTVKHRNQKLLFDASPLKLAVYPSVTENRHCRACCQWQQLANMRIDNSMGQTHRWRIWNSFTKQHSRTYIIPVRVYCIHIKSLFLPNISTPSQSPFWFILERYNFWGHTLWNRVS